MSTTTMRRADNHDWAVGERMRLGFDFQCLYGLGKTNYEKCAKRCRDRENNKTCYRSGSACARGELAMTKVLQ